jgi:hypothetical protein
LKNLQGLRPSAQKIQITFHRAMYVRENTPQAAGVEFCRCAAKLRTHQTASLLAEKSQIFRQ